MAESREQMLYSSIHYSLPRGGRHPNIKLRRFGVPLQPPVWVVPSHRIPEVSKAVGCDITAFEYAEAEGPRIEALAEVRLLAASSAVRDCLHDAVVTCEERIRAASMQEEPDAKERANALTARRQAFREAHVACRALREAHDGFGINSGLFLEAIAKTEAYCAEKAAQLGLTFRRKNPVPAPVVRLLETAEGRERLKALLDAAESPTSE